jgi:hypothetical protein
MYRYYSIDARPVVWVVVAHSANGKVVNRYYPCLAIEMLGGWRRRRYGTVRTEPWAGRRRESQSTSLLRTS